MKPHWSVPYLLFLLILPINWYLLQEYKSDKRCEKLDSAIVQVHYRINAVESSVDSFKLKTDALGKSILYLDSCQQVKATKTERAERRGKFVGGLLKGLFPLL
jgi:hypothetical protein